MFPLIAHPPVSSLLCLWGVGGNRLPLLHLGQKLGGACTTVPHSLGCNPLSGATDVCGSRIFSRSAIFVAWDVLFG